MGGYVPIVGATASLYQTANIGGTTTGLGGGYYIGNIYPIATYTTDSHGGFTFTAANSCSTSSPDEYYITIEGGNSGVDRSNQNILLMAAIGNCSQLLSDTFVVVNEVTTVAAAYALAPFLSVTNGGYGTYNVNVVASSTNYAATASSTGTIYHPVGLQHAFLNAYNLADVTQGGTARTVHPTNPSAVMPAPLINSIANVLQECTNSTGSTPEMVFTYTAPTASTPGTLISNTIGASDTISGLMFLSYQHGASTEVGPFSGASQATIAAAIQSAISGLTATWNAGVLTITGAPGTNNLLVISGAEDPQYTGPGSPTLLLDVPATPNACGAILAAALPLTTGTATVPTNTLQAALNIARNPYMGGAGKAATFLNLSVGIGTNPFTPVLAISNAGTVTALPRDLTAAITYPSTQWSTPATYNSAATLDANDQIYIASENGGATAYYDYELNSMSSNGTIQYTHPYSNSSTYVAGAEQVGNISRIQADSAGNIWMVNAGSTQLGTAYATTQTGVIQVTAATGAFSGYPASTSTQASEYPLPAPGIYGYSIAVDQQNNVWVGTGTSGTSYAIYEFPYSSNSLGTAVLNSGTLNKYAYQMIFDANQNLLVSDYSSTAATNYVAVVPNLNLASSTYPQSSANAALSPLAATSTSSIVMNLNAGGSYDYGVAVDSAGKIYSGSGTTGSIAGASDGINVTAPVYTQQATGTYAGKYAVSSLNAVSTTPIPGAAMSTTNGLINVAYSRSSLMTEDGNSGIWAADIYNDTVIRIYGTSGTSVLSFVPCVGSSCVLVNATGQTSATAAIGGLYGSREVYADSTGALWVMGTSVGTGVGGNITQIFGVAAPSFPLLQAGHPAQMP
jgi:hypothetical protein